MPFGGRRWHKHAANIGAQMDRLANRNRLALMLDHRHLMAYRRDRCDGFFGKRKLELGLRLTIQCECAAKHERKVQVANCSQERLLAHFQLAQVYEFIGKVITGDDIAHGIRVKFIQNKYNARYYESAEQSVSPQR